jgi:hypothetical protein
LCFVHILVNPSTQRPFLSAIMQTSVLTIRKAGEYRAPHYMGLWISVDENEHDIRMAWLCGTVEGVDCRAVNRNVGDCAGCKHFERIERRCRGHLVCQWLNVSRLCPERHFINCGEAGGSAVGVFSRILFPSRNHKNIAMVTSNGRKLFILQCFINAISFSNYNCLLSYYP